MLFWSRKDVQSTHGGNTNIDNDKYYVKIGRLGRFGPSVVMGATYILIQMIATFIIIGTGIVAYTITYKSTITDPIENVKNIFINSYVIIIGGLLVITFLINYLSKNKEILLKRLKTIFVISIFIMLGFLAIRLNMDIKYNNEKFYKEQNVSASSDTKDKISIGLLEMNVKTQGQYYVDECFKLYNIFETKTYSLFGMHLILNILLVYQIIKILKMQNKKDRINKDDIVLFDDEENIKF